MDVRYAFQQLDDLPAGYAVPEGRVKPWGTSHAILSARDVIDGPFAVINADDYYGPEAFQKIYDYLLANPDRDGKYEYAMVGYLLENTVTENGHVARGICVTNAEGYLDSVTVVSMNMWGFTRSFLAETGARFAAFLDNALKTNPLKGEYFLPSVVSQLIAEDKAQVKVLHSRDKWYGVTYKEDKPVVVAAIAEKTAQGLYPDNLWEV